MSHFKKLLLVVLAIVQNIKSDDGVCPAKAKVTTIYNVREGIVLSGFATSDWSDPRSDHIETSTISDLRQRYSEAEANWYIIYSDTGYIKFQNHFHTEYCLTYRGRNRLAEFKKCDSSNNQFFEIIPTGTGESLIKAKDNNDCLYVYSGFFAYYTYFDTCPEKSVNSKWLWVFLPQYSETVSI